MAIYVESATQLHMDFKNTRIVQIGREKNTHADSLASLASAYIDVGPMKVSVEVMDGPSIKPKPSTQVNATFYGLTWMDKVMQYLRDNVLPQTEERDIM